MPTTWPLCWPNSAHYEPLSTASNNQYGNDQFRFARTYRVSAGLATIVASNAHRRDRLAGPVPLTDGSVLAGAVAGSPRRGGTLWQGVARRQGNGAWPSLLRWLARYEPAALGF